MYHPESDCVFEVDASELPEMMKSIDGQLCSNVTGDPRFEARFKRERTRGTSQSAAT